MTQTDWDPLKDLVGIQERMNKLFESALARTNFDAEGGVGAWTPVADVYEDADTVAFCVELPGLAQADIDVRLEDDELVVRGSGTWIAARTGNSSTGWNARMANSYADFACVRTSIPRRSPPHIKTAYS